MKIVIQTQIRENYGDADKPYWKFKGGDTYVVSNLSVAQTLKVKDQGIPTLKALIETRNEGFEEYVVDWSIVDDDAVICEEWETPTQLSWEQGRWVARRTIDNGEYGYMRSEIASKSEEYDMLMGGGRENYKVTFLMHTGETLSSEGLEQFYKEVA
jgi:hypothetical protein